MPTGTLLFCYMDWSVYGDVQNTVAPRNDAAVKVLQKICKQSIEIYGPVAFLFRSSSSRALTAILD